MDIVVHDFGGYAFPVELSRCLARWGNRVHHIYFRDLSAARGPMRVRASDPDGLHLLEVTVPSYKKYQFATKPFRDRKYGQRVGEIIRGIHPDIVISSDTPLDAQAALVRACRALDVPFVYWVQDLISVGIRLVLSRQCGALGAIAGRWYGALEARLLRASAAVVAPAPLFLPHLLRWGIPESKCHQIENWSPLDDIAVLPQSNRWSQEMGLAGKTCVLYSGSLGLKHRPAMFYDLAVALSHRPDVVVVVVAEGPGADWLSASVQAHRFRNLRVIPLQPYERLSEVLASASVLFATLGSDASKFCFPSKILTYLSTGRPIVAAVPRGSYAESVLAASQGGIAVEPGDPNALADVIERLLDDAGLAERLADSGLKYAKAKFEIETIARRFLSIFEAVCASRKPVRRSEVASIDCELVK